MQPLGRDELKQFAPRALPEYTDALLASHNEMQRNGFTTPLRLCEFLAQAAHETGGFTILREDTSWSKKRMCEVWPKLQLKNNPKLHAQLMLCPDEDEAKANFIYSARTDIGNRPGTDDGWVYRGAYLFQDTGRHAWGEASRYCGVNFVDDPTLYNVAQSVKYWIRKWNNDGFHRLADRHYSRAIGNKINRGSAYSKHDPIGYKSRLEWFEQAWRVFGPPGEQPQPLEGMALGAYGDEVRALQSRLRELGYGIGEIDGVFGPTVARAVAAFKLDHKRRTGQALEEDEIVSVYTIAALNIAQPAEMAPERATTTEKEIVAASTTAAAGASTQKAGTAMVATGVTAAAVDSGLLDLNAMTASVDWLPGMQSVLTPVASAAMWGIKNAMWVVPLVFGFWFWQKGRHVVMARLKDHWSGFNLSK